MQLPGRERFRNPIKLVSELGESGFTALFERGCDLGVYSFAPAPQGRELARIMARNVARFTFVPAFRVVVGVCGGVVRPGVEF